MQKRYYTVEEANEIVPFLEEAFSRILQMRQQISELLELLDLVDAAPETDDFDIALPDASPAVIHNRGTLKALTLCVQDEVAAIKATGCLIKSIDNGLVDFYGKKGGRDVFLCWRLGEKEIGFWHDTRDGFRGRRPVSELYEGEEVSEISEVEEKAKAS